MNIPSFLDNIINLVKPKEESVLGIDIGSSSIKVVQVRQKTGRAILETYGEIALGPYGNTDIGRAVKLKPNQAIAAVDDVLREANTTTKLCGVAIPLASSLITTMKIPQVAGTNLEEMVTMEARRYIPVSLAEITLDWQVIPEVAGSSAGVTIAEGATATADKPTSANILIVAVHTETITDLKQLSDSTLLQSKFFELEAFSTIRASIPGERRTVAVVDFGASATKVYVAANGVIKLSHIIPFGSQDTTLSIARATGMPVSEAERRKRQAGMGDDVMGVNLKTIVEVNAAFVTNEILKVVREYQMKNGTMVEEVVFTGGGIAFKGLYDLISQKLGIRTRIADPFQSLVAPAFLSGILKDIGPSFSVAIGAALRALAE
ncbi:MAG: type IV pilus assembly protein PilM [Candidatus Taylorbacteria bacterium]|nr:type IV pilus assembly protein PilM [Candidatus Taylorbacteria bacterium]